MYLCTYTCGSRSGPSAKWTFGLSKDAVREPSPKEDQWTHEDFVFCPFKTLLLCALLNSTCTVKEDGDSMNGWTTRSVNIKGSPVVFLTCFFSWQRPLGVPTVCSWAVCPCLFENILVQSDAASRFLYMYNQTQTIKIAQLNSVPTGNYSSKDLLLS